MARPGRGVRYPLEPLVAWCRGRCHDPELLELSDARVVARMLGRHPRELYRWGQDGGVPDSQADRVAVALGVLPFVIWPAWLELGLELDVGELERRRALKAAQLRRYRAAHPEQREKARQYARAYYRQHREGLIAEQRRRDAARGRRHVATRAS